MRAGRLRHLVELQRDDGAQDAAGQHRESWGMYAMVYAAVEPASGREYQLAGQTQAELNVPMTIRYRTDVKPKDRIVWRDRVFEIVAVTSVNERDREMDLSCVEVVD